MLAPIDSSQFKASLAIVLSSYEAWPDWSRSVVLIQISMLDIGWYGSSYLLTTTALQPTFGRIYTIFSIKWTFLTAISIFELG